MFETCQKLCEPVKLQFWSTYQGSLNELFSGRLFGSSLLLRHLKLRNDEAHEPLVISRAKIHVIDTLDAFEVGHHVADDAGCLDCCSIWAGLILCTCKHGDWDLVNASDVNKVGLFHIGEV